jgi:hypothetical protein
MKIIAHSVQKLQAFKGTYRCCKKIFFNVFVHIVESIFISQALMFTKDLDFTGAITV